MASTNKTALGFNKWIETDKPVMDDFNNDNKIAEEIGQDFNFHKNNKNNPHEVTAEQINTYDKEYINSKVDSENGSICSICEISNSTGNIDILGGTGIQISTDNNNKSITIIATGEAVAESSVTKKFTTILLGSSWSNKKYTVTNSAITATNVVELYPAPTITNEQFEALQSANVIGGTQTTGSIELKAMGDVPTIDIPVVFLVRGDTIVGTNV